VPLELDADATVETLRREILKENERREALEALPDEDPANSDAAEYRAGLPRLELFIGTYKLEDAQVLADLGVRDDTAADRDIVVHPCWAKKGESVDNDAARVSEWFGSLAFVDPDWWREFGEQTRENWRVRYISMKRHWEDGQLWPAMSRAGSSPYWPFDYRDRVSLNTDPNGL